MIVVERYHLADHSLCLRFKIWILHVLKAQTPGMVLLPDQDALLVTQIQEYLIVRIVHGADGVGAKMPDQLYVGCDCSVRQRTAKLRVILMPAESFDPDSPPVQQDPVLVCPDLAKSKPVDEIVHLAPALFQLRPRRIQMGIADLPRLHLVERKVLTQRDFLIRPDRHRLPSMCSVRDRDADIHSLVFFREIDSRDLRLCHPFSVSQMRRDVKLSDVKSAELFQHDRSAHAAVGHIVVGNVEGAPAAETVVRPDRKRVLPFPEILYDHAKCRVSIVVGSDLLPVERHASRVAHTLEFQPDRATRIKFRSKDPLAPVIRKIREILPAAGCRHLKCPALVFPLTGREFPQAPGELLLLSHIVCCKSPDHLIYASSNS